MMSGFYLMHRGWMNNPVLQTVRHEPFSRREAWCWLIENAAYQATKVRVSGKVVDLHRGQLTHSLRHIGDAWGWEYSRVRRFFTDLLRNSMIATDDATGQNIITICNYDEYQASSFDGETGDATAAQQQRNSSATNKKEGKEVISSEAKASSALDERARDVAQAMVEVWRAECGDILAVPGKLDARRVAGCNARWRDTFDRSLDEWRAYCQSIRAAPFCCGDSERGWRADIEWALKPRSILNVREGKYATRRPARSQRGSAIDNLIEGFGSAAGLGDECADGRADCASVAPLLDGRDERGDAALAGIGLAGRSGGVRAGDRGRGLHSLAANGEQEADASGYQAVLH